MLTLKLLEELKEVDDRLRKLTKEEWDATLKWSKMLSDLTPSLISAAEWALENGFKPE